LENLNYIEGDLQIGIVDDPGFGNASLTSLEGLENLNSIGGGLILADNPALFSPSGLENLTSIGGYLDIHRNDNLASLAGLEGVMSIGGNLGIGNNHNLTNLTALGGLTSVGGYLWIFETDSLTSLSGLENINASTINNLGISNNSSLSNCDVLSICDYLVNPGGYIIIQYNAPGCNNQQEVQDDCDSITSISEIISEETFTISPNPLESISVIKYTIPFKTPVTINIFDLTGQEIIMLVNERQQQGEQQVIFNTSDLPTGIYFCVLKTNKGIQTVKIIKIE